MIAGLVLANCCCRGQSIELISETSLASRSASGDSTFPVWSGSSRYLGFHSDARNLATNKVDWRHINAYLRDRVENRTWMISAPASPDQAPNGSSFIEAISDSGLRIVFASDASNLHPLDTNHDEDLYARDMMSANSMLISIDRTGTRSGNGASGNAAMTPDGRHVAFESAANDLTDSDSDPNSDIFVRDLQLGVTTLVSVHANTGWKGNAGSFSPQISADGRFVAFLSASNGTTSATTPAAMEIFLRDQAQNLTYWVSSNLEFRAMLDASRILGRPTLASTINLSPDGLSLVYKLSHREAAFILRYDHASGETRLIATNAFPFFPGAPDSSGPVVSDDGKWVAYQSHTNVLGARSQIILWNADTGDFRLASAGPDGAPAKDGDAAAPMISRSGKFVAFLGAVPELAAGSSSQGRYQTFIHDVAKGTVSRASQPTSADPDYPAFNPEETLLALQMQSSGLPGDENRRYDVFVYDLTAKTTELISERLFDLPPAASPGANSLLAMSSSGRFVVRSGPAASDYDLAWQDLDAQTTRNVRLGIASSTLEGGELEDAALSGDGLSLVFAAFATNVANGDTNRAKDVFLHDFQSGETMLVSRTTNGVPSSAGGSSAPSISADGRWVAFQSASRELTSHSYPSNRLQGSPSPSLYNPLFNVFAYDRLSNAVHLVSVSSDGAAAGDDRSANPVISPNGRYVAFLSLATNIVDDFWPAWKWVIRDLRSGRTKEIEYVDFNGSHGSDNRREGAFSSDGGVFVYVSSDAPNPRGISAAEVETGAFQQVCTNCGSPSISGDGRFVAFEAYSNPGLPRQIHLFDRVSGAVTIASRRSPAGAEGNGKSTKPHVSDDGRVVIFKSAASNLAASDPNSLGDLFLWERMSGSLSTLAPLPAGANLTFFGDYQISADGNRVVFEGCGIL